jgi:hypothetical protein
MGDRARQLLDDALQLPLADRAEMAAELLASMDGEPDADVEAVWAAEIEQRARRAIAGESTGGDWADVRGRILSVSGVRRE